MEGLEVKVKRYIMSESLNVLIFSTCFGERSYYNPLCLGSRATSRNRSNCMGPRMKVSQESLDGML